MSSKSFRRIALKLAGAVEGAHGGHPDFRVNGRIFATLGYPDEQSGMVVLTPDQQAMLVDAEPGIFRPVAGAWGKRGSTNVNLAAADPATLKSALTMAWTNRLAKGGAKRPAPKRPAPQIKKMRAKRSKPKSRKPR